jgi:chromosome partitioning protein
MLTIAVASAKGGTGKTTLTAALGVRAREDRMSVALIDADPQGSLRDWYEERTPDEGLLLMSDEKVVAGYEAARKRKVDLCLIDTPPAYVEVLSPSVRLADLVVIPLRPSPGLDVAAVDAVIAACHEQSKLFLFILTQVIPRSVTEHTRAHLASKGKVCEQEIGMRQAYVTAMSRGLSGAEADAKAREEIDAVWRIVKRLVKGAVR